jgi:segregation and condensation protein B
MAVETKYIIESALFSAGRPLEVEEISEACELGKVEVRKALKELAKEYKAREGAIEVAQVGNKYAMQLRTQYAAHAAKLAQMEVPLKVLKTAALIAYYQPVPQSELKKLLGSKIYDHVAALHDLGLIRTRRKGQTKILYTTPRFSEYFGISEVTKQGIKQWLAKKVGMKEATGTLEEFFEKIGTPMKFDDESDEEPSGQV